jgi:hypothetical protein
LLQVHVYKKWTQRHCPAWSFRCVVCKSSPGSVTAKVQFNTTLPDLILAKKVNNIVKIDTDGRKEFFLGTVKGELTKRHNEITIVSNLSLIGSVTQ